MEVNALDRRMQHFEERLWDFHEALGSQARVFVAALVTTMLWVGSNRSRRCRPGLKVTDQLGLSVLGAGGDQAGLEVLHPFGEGHVIDVRVDQPLHPGVQTL